MNVSINLKLDKLELAAQRLTREELLVQIGIHSGLEQAVYEQEFFIRETYHATTDTSTLTPTPHTGPDTDGHDLWARRDDVWAHAYTSGVRNRGLYCVR